MCIRDRDYGLDVKAYRAEPGDLRELPLPAILHWELNHFVVLERLGRRRAVVVDPARGRRSVSVANLRRSFTGIVLTFSRTAALRPRAKSAASVRRYSTLARKALPALEMVVGASLLLNVLGLLVAA